jgi:transformation/transcription domain-associated protein
VIISLVNKAITAITSRLQSLSQFDGTDSKVSVKIIRPWIPEHIHRNCINFIFLQVGTLVAAACSADNLCRMDPAWHPWL